MLVLAMSSSTSRHSVALVDRDDVAVEVFVGIPFRHAELLPKALGEVFSYAGLKPAEIDAVAVDVGPGLYTGLRAGIAAAKAFCLVLRKPLIPVPSLWAMGYRAGRLVGPRTIAIADARRKEVFWQVLPPSIEELLPELLEFVDRRGGSEDESHNGPRTGGSGARESQSAGLGMKLGRLDDLVSDLEVLGRTLGDYTAVGEGALIYRDEILRALSAREAAGGPKILEDMAYPVASAVAAAAQRLANLDARVATDPENIRAVYMRAADARRAAVARPASLVPEEVFIS